VTKAKCWTAEGLACDRDKDFSLLQSAENASGVNRASYAVDTGYLSPGVKLPGPEAEHYSPSSAEVKEQWDNTSMPPYAFVPCTRTTALLGFQQLDRIKLYRTIITDFSSVTLENGPLECRIQWHQFCVSYCKNVSSKLLYVWAVQNGSNAVAELTGPNQRMTKSMTCQSALR
jgi:hypothetical protein